MERLFSASNRLRTGRRRAWMGLSLLAAALLAAACNRETAGPEPQTAASCAELSAELSKSAPRGASGDPQDLYKVIAPNGGETYHVGDTLEVVVAAGVYDQEGIIHLTVFRNGEVGFHPLPGSPNTSIDPRKDCRWRFAIPDSVGSAGAKTSLVSDSVKIRHARYNHEGSVYDYSDGFFRVLPR